MRLDRNLILPVLILAALATHAVAADRSAMIQRLRAGLAWDQRPIPAPELAPHLQQAVRFANPGREDEALALARRGLPCLDALINLEEIRQVAASGARGLTKVELARVVDFIEGDDYRKAVMAITDPRQAVVDGLAAGTATEPAVAKFEAAARESLNSLAASPATQRKFDACSEEMRPHWEAFEKGRPKS